MNHKSTAIIFFFVSCAFLCNFCGCGKKYFTPVPRFSSAIDNCEELRRNAKRLYRPKQLSKNIDEVGCDSLITMLIDNDSEAGFYCLSDSIESLVMKIPFKVIFRNDAIYVYSIPEKSYCSGVLLEGDKIISVNTKRFSPGTIDSMFAEFIVASGTEVILELVRNGVSLIDTVKVEAFKESGWENRTIRDSILYLRSDNFPQSFSLLIPFSLASLGREGFEVAMILDLRSNRQTGYWAALQFLDFLFPKHKEYLRIKYYANDKILTRTGKGVGIEVLTIYVLTNETTAGGASLIADVIQKNKRGIVLGTPAQATGALRKIVPVNDTYLADLTNMTGQSHLI